MARAELSGQRVAQNSLKAFDRLAVRFQKTQVLLRDRVALSWRPGVGSNDRLDLPLHLEVARIDTLQAGEFQILLLQRASFRDQRFGAGVTLAVPASTFFANSSAAVSSGDSTLSIADAPPMMLVYSA